MNNERKVKEWGVTIIGKPIVLLIFINISIVNKKYTKVCLKMAKSYILWVKFNVSCHELYINTILYAAFTPGELSLATCTR